MDERDIQRIENHLNIEIAEKVFGWRVESVCCGNFTATSLGEDGKIQAMTDDPDVLWASSWVGMGQLTAELARQGWRLSLEHKGGETWRASFARSQETISSEEEPTAPIAVCKAALIIAEQRGCARGTTRFMASLNTQIAEHVFGWYDVTLEIDGHIRGRKEEGFTRTRHAGELWATSWKGMGELIHCMDEKGWALLLHKNDGRWCARFCINLTPDKQGVVEIVGEPKEEAPLIVALAALQACKKG